MRRSFQHGEVQFRVGLEGIHYERKELAGHLFRRWLVVIDDGGEARGRRGGGEGEGGCWASPVLKLWANSGWRWQTAMAMLVWMASVTAAWRQQQQLAKTIDAAMAVYFCRSRELRESNDGDDPPSAPPSPSSSSIRRCHPIRKKKRTRCGSPPHKWFLLKIGCSSPFMRLAEHLTALCAWCT